MSKVIEKMKIVLEKIKLALEKTREIVPEVACFIPFFSKNFSRIKNFAKKLEEDKTAFAEFLIILSFVMFFLGKLAWRDVRTVVAICALSSLVVFSMELLIIYKKEKQFFSTIILFLLAFYFFQNGQLLLYVLKVDFADHYIQASMGYLIDVAVFSSISNMWAGFAGVLKSKDVPENAGIIQQHWVDSSFDDKTIISAARLGFVLTAIVGIPMASVKLYYGILGGYDSVRNLESGIPAILMLLEYMMVPFGLLCIIYDKNKKANIIEKIIMVFFFGATTLCGDRTTGIAGLFVIAYIVYLIDLNERQRKVGTVFMMGACGLLFILIRVAALFRSQHDISLSLFGRDGVITQVIAELGFTFFPLYIAMSIVPIRESFSYGTGYLASLISGVIPASIDPTGLVRALERKAHINEEWQHIYFPEYKFGLGFSLNAEAYMNFGWFGIIAIFGICLLAFHFLQYTVLNKNKPSFRMYQSCILLFSWFTLARRDTYYLWKPLAYCILAIQVYIFLYNKARILIARRR